MGSTHSRSDDVGGEPAQLHPYGVTLTLPESLRSVLKKPFGDIYPDNELKDALEKYGLVAAVGDMTALTLKRLEITPHIAVVDFKTERKELASLEAEIRTIGIKVAKLDNPAATITKALWEAIRSAYGSDDPTRVEVNGEEDLATLVCIHLAPMKSAVVYGQPKEGVVLVEITQKIKNMVRNILANMEE